MPIIYVHGVANRLDGQDHLQNFEQSVKPLLRRYVAPVLSATPDKVNIRLAYWGEAGVRFAWNGASRPKSVLLGQGTADFGTFADQAAAIGSLPATRAELRTAAPATSAAPPGLIGSGPGAGSGQARLKTLSATALSDLLGTFIAHTVPEGSERTGALIAADETAHDPVVQNALAAAPDLESEVEVLRKDISARTGQTAALVGMGAGWLGKTMDSVRETVARIARTPERVVSTVLLEIRKPLNGLLTLFTGDVFIYLHSRGNSNHPGEIPAIVLSEIEKARVETPNEPIVVLSHSMGGQIIYDLVTHFLPGAQGGRIDFWGAAASQVGLFEEEKLFLASRPEFSAAHNNKTPFPDRKYLGGWWNVWDSNDIISFTAQPIFEEVDDESYNSGVSVAQAHGEYLVRPSFYRRFAEKLTAAKNRNWNRP
jgi:hypothetical protein